MYLFKLFTVLVAFILSIVLFGASVMAFLCGVLGTSLIALFLGFGSYAFSLNLSHDLEKENKDDDDDGNNMTTIYKFA